MSDLTEDVLAPLMLAVLWNWTLYGALVVQLYVYSYNFPGDSTLLKLLVYFVFLVETLQTALTGADAYYWFVSSFGNDFLTLHLFGLDVGIIGSVISLTVQLFFVYRIWVLSGRSAWSRFLCLSICLCSIVEASAAFYAGGYLQIHDAFPSGRVLNYKTLVWPWLFGSPLSDILIAGSMLFYLRRRRGDGHFSDHALSRIVRLTIETNVLTTTVGIVALLMAVIFPGATWFMCPVTILGKLYSNTLLVSLNNRITIREGSRAVATPAVTFALATDSRPTVTVEIVQEKLRSPGARPSEDSARQDTDRVFDIA